MPILPPTAVAPYDSVQNILNTARMRLNDALKSLESSGGKIVEDTEAFTQQAANTAYRKMQEFLANLGITRNIQEAVIPSLPVVASLDPATQCFISWQTYFDGVNFVPAPTLPADMIFPLKIWERTSGQNACFPCEPMEQILDGLPSRSKVWCSGYWEWRQDAIYFPGSLMVMDFRLRYANFLADFADSGNIRWFDQPVPIARCQSAFAWYLCAEFVSARGDEARAMDFTARAEADAKLIMNREFRQNQRVNVRRQPRGRSGNQFGWGMLG